MFLHQLRLSLRLKLKIWQRTIREIPVVYLVLLSLFAFAGIWVLLKINIVLTWKSAITVAIIQSIICTQLHYKNNKKEFLNQFPNLYPIFLFSDTFLSTLPFLLIDIYHWFIALTIGTLYTILSIQSQNKIRIKQTIIPSPFFPKSAYLWHSQFRVSLPVIWLFILAISIIAYAHNNFNLAIVTYCGGIFISLIRVIWQKEEADFVAIYLNSFHFRKRITLETFVSTIILALPLSVLIVCLFPPNWQIIVIAFISIILVSFNLLWIKYIFYPSIILSSLFFFVGVCIQFVCALSPYSIPLIPIYYIALYLILKKKTDKYFTGNERIDY